ncbi:odorant receptor 74a [Stomoxys calcitrans]|uniref:odorant receptor 74a n=1 Tax=Stomoxys calcitrans TaxID=35570 RepID=UPI0027E3276E|nr:odorant receptor 74a [Stomoxys calcitrans]
MEFHRPLLANGKIAPLSWEIRLFFLNVNWPIKEHAKLFMRVYHQAMLVLGFLFFCYSNEAEMHYLVNHIDDIGLALEGLATYLILVEAHLRIYNKGFYQASFKNFLDEFYQNIYMEEYLDKETYRDIQRKLLPTKMCSYSYILTVVTYFLVPVMGFFQHSNLVPFKTIFHYDLGIWYFYVPTLLVTLWIGVAVVSHLSAESNLVATVILHLNARYLHLQQELKELQCKLSSDMKISTDRVLGEYRLAFIDIIKRNVQYNEFAQKFQKQYSFCIFVMMAFSATLLCVLGFKAATLGMTTKNITFITWILGKIVELLVFGTLGSTLIETTNNMSSCYYMANWEDIILKSSHTLDNIKLMKLITLAIELNQKPFYLTGYNYFNVSLATVIAILQGAGSYFTFLYAFR